MITLPLRWVDEFTTPELQPLWVGGYLNTSTAITIALGSGLQVRTSGGAEYASAGVVSRVPVAGDFDARVRFSVTNPTKGTTFELAAITVDPPSESALVHDQANQYTLSRAYDVHGTPPYVSSEFDEGDGWRIGWNRSTAQTRPKLTPAPDRPSPPGAPVDGAEEPPSAPASARTASPVELVADNHFNRYGKSGGPKPAGAASGWLRLVRLGDDWTSYRLGEAGDWIPTGSVRRMNLPPAVFLRLAAKQWPKQGEPAPQNTVTFERFELRAAQALPARTDHEISRTLSLGGAAPEMSAASQRMQDLRGCRKCDAFWGETAYGPFIQVEHAKAGADDAAAVLTGTITGFSHPEPATLYGCRKAPIMLIGINPNLPAHFLVPRKPKASEWSSGRSAATEEWKSGAFIAMPFFGSDQQYAGHYRQRPSGALQLRDVTDLEGLLAGHGRLIADNDGELVPDDEAMGGSYRVPGRRMARLAIQYKGADKPVLHDIEWKRDESLAVVRRSFRKGEIIAGLLTSSVMGKQIQFQRSTAGAGYYTRVDRLLTGVKSLIPGANLELGEDMSLHDVVACASPNWNDREFDTEAVRSHCVQDMRWMHRDVADCAPEVIVLAGRVALSMFAQTGAGRLSTPLEQLPTRAGGHGGLFSTVASAGLWWTYRARGVERSVRLVIAPHFSYSDNFLPQCYFTQAEWVAFQQRHSAIAGLLAAENRIKPVFGTGDTQVSMKIDDVLWRRIETADMVAATTMRTAWVDPVAFLSEAVVEALKERHVGLDANGHLKRSRSGCDFCDNPAWKLGQGCAYDPAP